ncbi:unnamed protein product [Prunus armeniaca]
MGLSRKTSDWNFISFLANCTSLEVLGLDTESFWWGIAKIHSQPFYPTKISYFGANLMHGSIHGGIGNLVNLSVLAMDYNYFSGSVPNEIGKLQTLQVLYLTNNRFSGSIPSALSNLTSLTKPYMGHNRIAVLWAVEKALKMEVGLLGSMMDKEGGVGVDDG